MVVVMAWTLALAVAGGEAPRPGTQASAAVAVDLAWHAPSDCPTRDDVLGAVARATEHAGLRPAAQVDAIVDGSADRGFVADVRIRSRSGELKQRVTGPTCQDVGDAVAVLVAAVVAPHAVAERAQVAARDPLDPLPSPPSSAARFDTEFFVRIGGAGMFGILPRWGGGPGLAGGVDIGRGRIEARANFDLPQQVLVSSTPARARFLAWYGAVLGCFVPTAGALSFPLCAGPEIGGVHAQASGLSVSRKAVRTVVDVVGSAALAYRPVSWLALRAQVDGMIVLTPGSFVIDDFGALHRIRSGGLRLGIGAEFRLGRRNKRRRP